MEYAILGSVDLSTPFEAISSKDSDAEIIRLRNDEYPHPQYDLTNLRHDILVLVLEKPSTRQILSINSNYTTPTFQSPTSTKMTTNSTKSTLGDGQLVALGFGLGSRFLELQQVSLDYVPNSMCMNMFRPVDHISGFPGITSDMLCTYTPGRDTCGGDSGGPLILVRPVPVESNGDGSGTGGTGWEEIQVGVTSWYVVWNSRIHDFVSCGSIHCTKRLEANCVGLLLSLSVEIFDVVNPLGAWIIALTQTYIRVRRITTLSCCELHSSNVVGSLLTLHSISFFVPPHESIS